MRKLSSNALAATLSVAVVHLLVTVANLITSHGHWGWYGSLVLTGWVAVYLASTLSDRADAAANAAAAAVYRR